jgi:hypothetical protein
VEIHGTCAEQFSRVRDAFIDLVTNGQDIGASVAVLIEGEPVIDLWGGYFDETYTRPWSGDTIANGFSSTKTLTALCALLLADRGQLDLDAPVAEYWPEFAAAGKAGVLVQQLLGHTSGLAGWTEHMTLDDIYDMELSTQLLAEQEPWWEPGTAAGYHAFTRATWSARSFVGSPASRSGRSSPTRSPRRSVSRRITTSGHRKRPTPGCPCLSPDSRFSPAGTGSSHVRY